jgi:hypothetical protein
MTKVARSGLAALGAGGLEFKSPRPDQSFQRVSGHAHQFTVGSVVEIVGTR